MDASTGNLQQCGSDLFSGILKIQVRNEEMITEKDRSYCQCQQDLLYRTLDNLDRWYALFKGEAEKYVDEIGVRFEDNGKVNVRDSYTYRNAGEDYSRDDFRPFDCLNKLVENNIDANARFADRIISYFNRTYSLSVPVPDIDGENLRMGFRPSYQTYVDTVIGHLGGKSFRETAEEELVSRFHHLICPSRWSTSRVALKKDRIIFPDIVGWDSIHLEFHGEYRFSYSCDSRLETLCEGIAYGSDGVINGSSGMVMRLDSDNVDISRWYELTTTGAEYIRFYKNGRIDVKFRDISSAEECYRRLRLDSINNKED